MEIAWYRSASSAPGLIRILHHCNQPLRSRQEVLPFENTRNNDSSNMGSGQWERFNSPADRSGGGGQEEALTIEQLQDKSQVTEEVARSLFEAIARKDMPGDERREISAQWQMLAMAAGTLDRHFELLVNHCDVAKVPGLDLTNIDSVDKYRALYRKAYEVLHAADPEMSQR